MIRSRRKSGRVRREERNQQVSKLLGVCGFLISVIPVLFSLRMGSVANGGEGRKEGGVEMDNLGGEARTPRYQFGNYGKPIPFPLPPPRPFESPCSNFLGPFCVGTRGKKEGRGMVWMSNCAI